MWLAFVLSLEVLLSVGNELRNGIAFRCLSRRLAQSPGTFVPFYACRRFTIGRSRVEFLATFCNLSV
jgi:hypothetical protein